MKITIDITADELRTLLPHDKPKITKADIEKWLAEMPTEPLFIKSLNDLLRFSEGRLTE